MENMRLPKHYSMGILVTNVVPMPGDKRIEHEVKGVAQKIR